MVLELKLRKIGNSVGVVLPKEALTHLHVEEGGTICVTDAADGTLRMSATRPDFARQMEVAPTSRGATATLSVSWRSETARLGAGRS
jgi:putative addiction module antidote